MYDGKPVFVVKKVKSGSNIGTDGQTSLPTQRGCVVLMVAIAFLFSTPLNSYSTIEPV